MSDEVVVKHEDNAEDGSLVATTSLSSPVAATAAVPSVVAANATISSTATVNSVSNCNTPAISNAPDPPVTSVDLTRIKLSDHELESISCHDLVKFWRVQDSFIDLLEAQLTTNEAEITVLRETESRLKHQHSDLLLREKILVRRLAAKEQEIQEYAGQLSELKAGQAPGAVSLRQALLDPAVNLLLQRLRQELHSTRTRLEETQNELNAWKFTPDSNTGKRLMAKCRLLYQENEELGRMISSGRLAKLEGDLALQKSFSEEVKKSQSELDEFLQDLDEDVEGMQSTIYYLQQELRKSKETVSNLEQELSNLRTSGSESNLPVNRVCSSSVNGVKENSFSVPSGLVVVKQEERTNGVSKVKEEWGNCKGNDDELSTDSSDVVLKINADDDLCDNKMDTQVDDLEQVSARDQRVTTNNRSPRKRTSSEDSDDVPLSKKVKIETSELSVHYNDDDSRLVNGESEPFNCASDQ